MAAAGLHDRDEYNMRYPEPPQFPPASMGLSPESYASYPRQSSLDYAATTMTYDANGSIYTEAPYMYQSKSSPGLYADDSDMRVPSSNLSIASASSSNMGSPLSNHGNLAPIPEWAATPQGLGVNPGIVDQSEYFPGTEYSYAPGTIDGYNPAFEFGHTKGPGFVGELSQVPRSRLSPRLGQTLRGSSMSSATSSESVSTLVPARSSSLALDTQLAQASVTASPASTSASSIASSLVFASPATSTTSCFPSPTPPAWCSPNRGPGDRSPPSAPKTPRLVSPFFSQSSGHFVPPLETSCWFPLSKYSRRTRTPVADSNCSTADPSLIHPDVRTMAMPGFEQPHYAVPNSAYPASPALSASPQLRSGNTSPFVPNNSFQPFSPFQPPALDQQTHQQRRRSLASFNSSYSGDQHYSDNESKEKQRCPHPDCGKIFKDLRAHMLTHQTERPEKCPIATCEYHTKGFARK